MARTPLDAAETRERSALRRRAVRSAWAGFAIDSYSTFLPAIALAPAIGYFQGGLSGGAAALFSGIVFAATLLGRPIGAVVFGRLADLVGRKRVGAITIYGFGAVTLLIACLPGAAQVGAPVAMTLLVVLRFADGIFLGGEYTAATPLALEHAEPHRRGFTGGLIQSAGSAGPALVSIATALALVVLPVTGPQPAASPYAVWGWRIPFVIGAVVAFAVARYLRSQVEDSPTQQHAAKVKSPIRELLRGPSGRTFVQVWIMAMGFFFGLNIVANVIPQLLLAIPGFTARMLTATQVIGAGLGVLSYIVFGLLSDRIGRKRAIVAATVTSLLVTPLCVTLIGLHAATDFAGLTVLVALASAAVVAPMGILPVYMNERFPTAIRSSGWGIAFSTAVVIPAFYAFYQAALATFMPFAYTGGLLIAFGALLVLIGLRSGPETRGIDLATAGQTPTGATTHRG